MKGKPKQKKRKKPNEILTASDIGAFSFGTCKLDFYCIRRSSLNPKYIKNSSRANTTILSFHINIPLYIKYINEVKAESFEYIYWWI